MANKLNNFPPAGLPVSAGIKTLNRDPRTSSGTGYYVTDALSVDFRIQGFVTSDTTNAHIDEYKKDGVKFIINTGSIPSAIINSYESDSSGGYGALAIGDVVVWNGAQNDGVGQWELWYDASSDGLSGPSGGAFGYIVEENQFYGYFGDVRGWDTVGVGNTGPQGDTGSDALVGAKYVQQVSVGAVDAEGEINVSNTAEHSIRVHRNAAGLNGFAGATSDLINVFFPNGVAASNDDTNPKVVVSFYNDTIDQTFAIRASLKADAIQDTNELLLDIGTASSYNFFEVLSSTSGSGAWIGAGVAWSENDEIYVLAVSDGIAGIDGSEGGTGATGQGITFGANIDGELNIQYIYSDGTESGLIPTGIVDGVTGDPGEVGFLLAATGSTTGISPIYWGNDTDGDTGDVQPGEIYYTNVAGEKIIAIHYTPKEGSASTPFVFGFTAGDLVSGTEFENKKGSLYFYEQVGKTLLLRSFLKYTQAKCTGNSDNELVLLKGITDTLVGGVDADRLGITLDGATTKDIFTLVSPDGLKGTGITFGEIVNNKLFLDYIDENGNTFGRFEAIEGVTGPQGSLNPFNIPYTAISAGTALGTGTIKRNADAALKHVQVSITGGNGDFVGDYIKYPISPNNDNRSGFLSVFSTTDVENFGVFRFDDGLANNADFAQFGTNDKPLTHVAGNITDIVSITDAAAGFTVGASLLFAINTDGPRGFSGAPATGFTYGNEYFVTTILGKPVLRSDNNPLEPGDKWFCTDVGLEFTFLGVSGDDVVEQSSGADANRDDIWVQTNNARQGQQGPRGDKGDAGDRGVDGITGINTFNTWTAAASYNERAGAYVTRQQCILAAQGNSSNIARINGNWDLLNSGAGATNGFFIVKTNLTGVSQIPGLFVDGGFGWNSGGSHWAPVVTNIPGVPGSIGNTGATGNSVIGFVAEESGSEVFLDAQILPEGGSNPADVITVNIRNGSGDDVNFRGPAGPSGNLVGNNNEIVFINGDTGEGTNAAVIDENSGTERLVLQNYREKTRTTSEFPLSAGRLTLDCDEPVVHFDVTGDETVQTVNLNNCSELGDGTTVYIHQKDGGTVTWNANQASEYLLNNVQFNDVFVSSQGFPTPGKIEFDSGEVIGAFTFKYIDNSPSTLVINYVQFVTPE